MTALSRYLSDDLPTVDKSEEATAKGNYDIITHLLARDVIYTSRAYATMLVSVCLWRKCIGAL